jgi:hypothetical protein
MDAEAVLKHRVRNEQTSGEKKSPSKGALVYYFFPAHMQIFRPIGHTFGSRRKRVKLVLKGIQNKDNTEKLKKNNVRKPITKEIMSLLKRRLRGWKANNTDQRLLWAVASNLFHGAFRIGELLGTKEIRV